MFTGIIESTGKILEARPGSLVIARPKLFDDLKLGSSVCISGVCLSVTELTGATMQFDVIKETLSKTTLGKRKKGDLVNLERAMQLTDRFEGHVVQGHVEGTATVTKMSGGKLTIDIPAKLMGAVLPIGSITIDGVSLTIAAVKGTETTVALIPHTLKHTTLGKLKKGDSVNIETDMLVRALHALYAAPSHAL